MRVLVLARVLAVLVPVAPALLRITTTTTVITALPLALAYLVPAYLARLSSRLRRDLVLLLRQ